MSVAAAIALVAAQAAPVADFRARPPHDEIVYFVLPDRFENADPKNDKGGIKGGRLKDGYDPTHKGFYHGGDLKGLTKRLDYIQGLGATAIWLTPIFKNKAVQGDPGQESSAYHGYWITDFTRVDPHLGTDADFKTFVDAAHSRGMKVYMDIIANHTADVLYPEECKSQHNCPYRSIADYPYQRRGGTKGAAINPGFDGKDFSKLTDPNYAYTMTLKPAEKDIKVPAWLNDPIYYHNRGNTTFKAESSTMGDFVGLDDLYTEHPRVVQGMIEIYGDWIDKYGVDGFRIDTARHVNPEFWAQFVPPILAKAKAKGIPNFHIFGEVADDTGQPGFLAKHTRRDNLPSVLDFAFGVKAIETASGGPTEDWREFFAQDVLYARGDAGAMQLPTFLGNHDKGRFSTFIRKALPNISEDELLDRVILGHVLLITARGVPTIYYGDEQGFLGDGNDQDAREDMFASRVAVYNDNNLVGSDATTAKANFDANHPLYRTIRELAEARKATPALRRGETVFRAGTEGPGLLAFSRILNGREVLVAVNTSTQPINQNVVVQTSSQRFTALAGTCPTTASAPGSVRVTLPALGYAVCDAR